MAGFDLEFGEDGVDAVFDTGLGFKVDSEGETRFDTGLGFDVESDGDIIVGGFNLTGD